MSDGCDFPFWLLSVMEDTMPGTTTTEAGQVQPAANPAEVVGRASTAGGDGDEKIYVQLSKGNWGIFASTLGVIVTAAGAWANSLQNKIETANTNLAIANTNLSVALSKIDDMTRANVAQSAKLEAMGTEFGVLQRRFDRFEFRLENLEQRDRHEPARVPRGLDDGALNR